MTRSSCVLSANGSPESLESFSEDTPRVWKRIVREIRDRSGVAVRRRSDIFSSCSVAVCSRESFNNQLQLNAEFAKPQPAC